MSSETNKSTVETMWRALSQMDWETLKSCLHPEVHYQDVPTDDPGAHGPENVVKRLGIAWREDEAQPGALVLIHVVPGSPAARAGLCSGDRIYQVGGREFADQHEFIQLANSLPGPLTLLVERHGQVQTVTLQLAAGPAEQAA